jgi:hypothetical protein
MFINARFEKHQNLKNFKKLSAQIIDVRYCSMRVMLADIECA